ncbi:MAG: hypothetical protein KAR20_13420, partial [Candidatus Heimdallarchaeota archaeon]|nr:hypothetical protein [Candidatus Heimdallarchaeota archaeon]
MTPNPPPSQSPVSRARGASTPPAPTSSGSAQPAPVQPIAPTSQPGYRARKPLPPQATNEVDLVILLGDINRSNYSTREFITLVKSENGKEFLIYGKDKPFSVPAYLVHKMCAGEISSLTGSNNNGGIHIKLVNKYIRFFSILKKTKHNSINDYAINKLPTAYTEPNVRTVILFSDTDGETKTTRKQFISVVPNPKNLHEHAELILTNITMSILNQRTKKKEISVEILSTPAVEIGSEVVASKRDADEITICTFDLSTKCSPY